MDISYKSPSVHIIDGSDPDLGYKLWKASKNSVVKEDGDLIHIGEETLSQTEYRDRVLKMNMQYNNFSYFVFEIQGSILFRDLLYNINKLAQWAVSLRLTHSVLDQSNISNFAVSEEYKGIPEWEKAFEDYFTAMQSEVRVDVNRIKMPYSVYSRYWIGINYRSLVELLSMMKMHMPFFYKVYGRKMAAAYNELTGTNIEDYYVSNLGSGMSKYFSSEEPFEEGCTKVDDYYLLKQKMGLILYSQFIRQADTDVKGLYSALKHTDSIEFSHKVFTGETVLDVTYLAHKDRVKKTLSNRLCWFSQSDGDESNPYYWSKFISTFLKNKSYQEIMDMMPCKFCNAKLKSCHYAEDVKFRDQKLQKGYIPCAILNKNIDYASQRYEECPNELNKIYKDITYYIRNRGRTFSINKMVWTSVLSIYTDRFLSESAFSQIETWLRIAKAKYYDHAPEFENYKMPLELSDEYKSYGLNGDITCMMKGYALDLIADYLKTLGYKSFMIDFGGDVYGHNTGATFRIENTWFNVQLEGNFSIFTSGNTDKRGNHIPTGHRGTTTVFRQWKSDGYANNTLMDIYATKCHANDFKDKYDLDLEFVTYYDYSPFIIKLTEDGKLMNDTYCASPFFNTDQIKIRNKMISNIIDPFRPDLTESSKKYDEGSHNSHLVEDVVRDNIEGIQSCDSLVFPVHTSDLGTLYEVGYAMSKNKVIFKYDYILHMYTAVDYAYQLPTIISHTPTLFDCSDKLNVISLGFYSSQLERSLIFYQLKGCPDNIMLSVKYTHVELEEDGKFHVHKRDLNERDN